MSQKLHEVKGASAGTVTGTDYAGYEAGGRWNWDGRDLRPADVRLPQGWICRRLGRDEIVFRPEQHMGSLEARKREENGWDLRYRQQVGEAGCERVLGIVPTRDAAVSSLFACMRALNHSAREYGSPDFRALTDVIQPLDYRPRIE